MDPVTRDYAFEDIEIEGGLATGSAKITLEWEYFRTGYDQTDFEECLTLEIGAFTIENVVSTDTNETIAEVTDAIRNQVKEALERLDPDTVWEDWFPAPDPDDPPGY